MHHNFGEEKHMLRIGITGQCGFIGNHLYNFLSLQSDAFTLIEFHDAYFDEIQQLSDFIEQCDVLIHLAGVNRDVSEEVVFQKNMLITERLIAALNKTESLPHIIFASSIQENKANPYGQAKQISREKLAKWAKQNQVGFNGLLIPNVFGPFGRPKYNSVVATFCSQVNKGEKPRIIHDAEIQLIYVQNLVEIITDICLNRAQERNDKVRLEYDLQIKVSEILSLIDSFRKHYVDNRIIPSLRSDFERNLFNTFRSYIEIDNFFPMTVTKHSDERGFFSELVKTGTGGQISFSVTKPGITRGNHFHIRKIERFVIIQGKAQIQLRRFGKKQIHTLIIDQNKPAFVDIPVWYTHNLTNIGNDELMTVFWINEWYNPNDTDTYFTPVKQDESLK
jgi:UDP-2-acetamido-2,6-beta-L-arabino-hexul-4-ose reductase